MTRAQQKSLAGLVLVALMIALLWWSNGSGEDAGSQQQTRETTSRTSSGPAALPTIEADQLNRERLLPEQLRGYYREYTVETPGEDDRGARRIDTGGDTMYWTDDHYSSFARIVGLG